MSEETIFKIGQRLSFDITSKITLPGTEEVNFILLGPDQKKYLLPEQYFTKYGLQVGQTINCSVDKINCSGKIFLEPEHPYYKVGERYDFLVVRISEQKDFLGKLQLTAYVKDIYNQEWPCPIAQKEPVQDGVSYLSCKIDRIKKGTLILSLPELTDHFNHLKIGQLYNFQLVDILTYQQEDFYLFKDPAGNYHRLPVANYRHYGFKLGQTVEATVVKYRPNGESLIEPIHPYYKIGETYLFKFKNLEKSINPVGRLEAVITVTDIYDQEIKVKPLTWQMEKESYHPESISCLVQRFKKGRPVLINLEP